jgi:hypothetical protein
MDDFDRGRDVRDGLVRRPARGVIGPKHKGRSDPLAAGAECVGDRGAKRSRDFAGDATGAGFQPGVGEDAGAGEELRRAAGFTHRGRRA